MFNIFHYVKVIRSDTSLFECHSPYNLSTIDLGYSVNQNAHSRTCTEKVLYLINLIGFKYKHDC